MFLYQDGVGRRGLVGIVGGTSFTHTSAPSTRAGRARRVGVDSFTKRRWCVRRAGDPKTFNFLGVATRSPHITEFPLETRGESAVYMLRWVCTRGTPGPWSEVAAARVAAVGLQPRGRTAL